MESTQLSMVTSVANELPHFISIKKFGCGRKMMFAVQVDRSVIVHSSLEQGNKFELNTRRILDGFIAMPAHAQF